VPRSNRIVKTPEPEPGSYNPDRPLIRNSLLMHQVMHFQKVERESMTEGQASEYIRRMTALLHPRAAAAGEPRGE
jgi:hypothetical protein